MNAFQVVMMIVMIGFSLLSLKTDKTLREKNMPLSERRRIWIPIFLLGGFIEILLVILHLKYIP